MRNVHPLPNGKWQFEIEEKNKRIRKNFNSKAEAIDFRTNFFAARKLDLAYFVALSGEQLKDIKDALAILPTGKTLVQSVQKAWQFHSDQNLIELISQFLEIKERKYEAGNLSKHEFVHIKGRINNFKSNFKAFSDITPEALLAYLKSKGANKTISHWRGTISELLDFCAVKRAIPTNPIQFLHSDELLVKDIKPHEIGFLTVEQAKAFLAFLEDKYPRFCRFYALAMFAGIRVAEIPRLKDEYFMYEDKKIIFPAKIGKVKKSWTLEDLPENLWVWLEKYKNTPIIQPSDYIRNESFKAFNLPHNFARHCFATYHLSLYFDAAKTSKITRNSEQMLKDHYWGALVDKAIAKAYFEILPK